MSNIDAIIARAATDMSFRSRLVANPRAVFCDEGLELPAETRVEVIETQPNEIHLQIGDKNRPPKLQAALDRAAADATIRQQLLKEPRKVLEDAYGKSLPSEVVVRVYEPLKAGVRLFLPPLQPAQEAELSDAELSAVAGGAFGARIKGMVDGIREWACGNTRFVNNDAAGNEVSTLLYTSHNDPVTLRPTNPTL